MSYVVFAIQSTGGKLGRVAAAFCTRHALIMSYVVFAIQSTGGRAPGGVYAFAEQR